MKYITTTEKYRSIKKNESSPHRVQYNIKYGV